MMSKWLFRAWAITLCTVVSALFVIVAIYGDIPWFLRGIVALAPFTTIHFVVSAWRRA